MSAISMKEARVLARLAWNNWPDNENSRREITAHESRDPMSAEAWDRVINALLAQRIEHEPSKLGVEGSNPSGRANYDREGLMQQLADQAQDLEMGY